MTEPLPWLELRPTLKGQFDELIARFADGAVHVEIMTDRSVYIGFYCDDGRAQQLWISSNKRLTIHTENADSAASASPAISSCACHLDDSPLGDRPRKFTAPDCKRTASG